MGLRPSTGGDRTHEKNYAEPKRFVMGEWARPGANYRSKADFVRVVLPLLQKKFPDCKVKEKTIIDLWMREIKSARGRRPADL